MVSHQVRLQEGINSISLSDPKDQDNPEVSSSTDDYHCRGQDDVLCHVHQKQKLAGRDKAAARASRIMSAHWMVSLAYHLIPALIMSLDKFALS